MSVLKEWQQIDDICDTILLYLVQDGLQYFNVTLNSKTTCLVRPLFRGRRGGLWRQVLLYEK